MDVKKRFNFTKTRIQDLPPAEPGKRDTYFDTQSRGLIVRVSDKGVKSYYFRRKIKGISERIFLGLFEDISVEQARGMAAGHRGTIAKGENPADKLRADRAELTLRDFFDEHYLPLHAKPKKRTWKEDVSKFDQYIADGTEGMNLAARKMSTIRKSHVAALHAKIGNAPRGDKTRKSERDPKAKHTKKVTANHVLALLSSIFGKAIKWGLYAVENPCSGIDRFPEHERERYVQPDELPRFFAALADEPLKDFFLLALLTGARSGNLKSMRWEDIVMVDGGRAEWRIPKTKNKGKPQTIPLTAEAVGILQARRDAADADDENAKKYVFPSDGKLGHLREPKKGWRRVLKAAKLTDLRIHDLRRTLGSFQVATGATLAVVQKTLGHADISTTQIYARLSLDPVKAAMQTAVSTMWTLGGLKPAGEVVPMKKKRKAQ